MNCTPDNTYEGPLLIRYKDTDDGTRPIIPPTDPYWNSPDIWLDHPADTTVDDGTAVVAISNTIRVTITNIRNETIENVSVEVYVCTFDTGVSPETSLLKDDGTPLGKFTGSWPQIDPTTNPLTPIRVTVPCGSWIPTVGQLTQQSNHGGHVCMIANCFSDTCGQSFDTMDVPPGGSLPFQCDSHLAQRNISIVPFPAMQGRRGTLPFHVVNPHPTEAQEMVLKFTPVPFNRVLDLTTRQLLETSPFIKRVRTDYKARHLLIDERLKEPAPVTVSRLKKFDFELLPEGFQSGKIVKVNLPPKGRAPVKVALQLDPQETLGSLRAFDVSMTTLNGDLLGGVRFVTIITP